jgi:hypothetical protein
MAAHQRGMTRDVMRLRSVVGGRTAQVIREGSDDLRRRRDA